MHMSLTTLSRAALPPLTVPLYPLASIAARATTHHQRHQLHQSPNLKSLATFHPFHPQCPSFLHSYSTMSNLDSTTQTNTTNNQQSKNNPTSQNQEEQQRQQQQQQQQPYLSLPGTSSSSGVTNQLDLSGGGSIAKLDHLGPMVVNVDGTLSRISNWEQMTEIEKKTTLRVLGKRNKQRLDALKAAEGAGAKGEGQGQGHS